MRLAPVRIVWLALPLLAGPAASHALDAWADAPRGVATTLLWVAWGAGLVALLAPRPVGLTAVRTIAPAFAVVAIVATLTDNASALAAAGAVVATLAAALLVADPEVSLASANGIAYGDERRHPLRTPPALYLAPIPIARALAVVGVAAGPLLLADESVGWGLVALLGGLPLAGAAARSLHTLARRWVVLVPAGLVVVDPMTLADTVLVVRRQLRDVRAVPATAPIPDDAVDLRLGATLGTVAIVVDGALDVMRSRRRGRAVAAVRPASLVIAVVARRALLEAVPRRAAQAAMPPPSNASPS